MVTLTAKDWDDIVSKALAEDIGTGDITTAALEIAHLPAVAEIISHEDGTLYGMEAARRVFNQVDRRITFKAVVNDGQRFRARQVVARLAGPAGGILAGERVALNFLQWLSGIATTAATFVKRADSVAVTILDTRKTTPTLRRFEKAAVRAGGAENHRAGLYDGILIKDNHKRLCGGVAEAVARAKKNRRAHIPIIVEVETLAEAEEAAAAGVDIIMLDNFSAADAATACRIIGKRAAVEISGGVNLSNIGSYARAGASRISVGALTHSPRAVNFSLEMALGT